MENSLSLPGKLDNWSQRLNNKRENLVKEITASLLNQKVDRSSLNSLIHDRMRPMLYDYFIPECASTMGQKSASFAASDFVLLNPVFEHPMFESQQFLSDSSTQNIAESINPYRWLIPCFGGGLLGFLVMGTESSLGAFSGLLGAAAVMAGISYLSQNEIVQSRMALLNKNSASLKYTDTPFRQKASLVSSPLTWMQQKSIDVGVGLAAKLVNFVLKPETNTPNISSAEISAAVERGFDAFASLAFVICVMHCATEKDKSASQSGDGLQIAESSVHQALTILMRYLEKSPEDLETIRDMALELHQRLHDEGYAWENIPEGTPFSEDFKQRFRLFGLIEPGQPVQTLEPCFMRSGVVIVPGRITRVRG